MLRLSRVYLPQSLQAGAVPLARPGFRLFQAAKLGIGFGVPAFKRGVEAGAPFVNGLCAPGERLACIGVLAPGLQHPMTGALEPRGEADVVPPSGPREQLRSGRPCRSDVLLLLARPVAIAADRAGAPQDQVLNQALTAKGVSARHRDTRWRVDRGEADRTVLGHLCVKNKFFPNMRILITGASRGIGAACARVVAAACGSKAQIALLARSLGKPAHTTLEGTLMDVAKDVDLLGATPLPIQADFREPEQAAEAVRTACSAFGGLDVLINNASFLDLTSSPKTRHIQLAMTINAASTLACIHAALPHLRASEGAMVTLSPPLDLSRVDWIRQHSHYTVSKYAMTLATLGASQDVRANCLWPRRTVATAATASLEARLPGAYSLGRDPDDFARAVWRLARSSRTGECLYDEDVLPSLRTKAKDAPLDLFVC